MSSKPHDDLPTLVDRLNWNEELTRLCESIEQCTPPHVFGVHGDWGSGKTSFMRQLQWHLGGEATKEDGSVGSDSSTFSGTQEQGAARAKRGKKIVTIWFEAWRYQSEVVPVVALLHEMRRQLSTAAAVRGKFEKLGQVTLRYLLGSLSDAAKTIGVEALLPNADRIESIGEKWEKANLAESLPTDSIRGFLSAAIKEILPEDESARLVVFIDDLDRCNSMAAFRLLEGLKIYLNVPRCVFVIGMNEQTLVDAIAKELALPKEVPPAVVQLRAAHYLEKICTNVFRLPPPPNPPQHLGEWLHDDHQRQALLTAIGKLHCLPPNPRRLKALANQWSRFIARVPWPVGNAEQEAVAVRVLVAAYICQFHRDLWERWCFQPGFWQEIKAWCRGEVADRSSIVNDRKVEAPDAAELPQLKPPEWIGALRLPERRLPSQGNSEAWGSTYPDPNAIEIFWIAPLVREHHPNLVASDFEALLKCARPTT
ncbi:P-loop NTPase fold protein [Candidatus Accumulibacter vicinus]|uniref:Putative P-loop ATPase n=1 Tax=Candidatus Accumulibacter vicinus TaxID=2954382 RepID=A0A084XYF3_9PROT|nr:P-loop NTPase fold protein [Candidatus Accumulibacter vicinus]KFB67497.1 MAG: putative P-loop ATPase [Candidatus Accumulibacter vicinus]